MSSSTERPESPGQAVESRNGSVADEQPARDPWFEREPADGAAAAANEWFMRTGRAGLLPESMTDDEPEIATINLPRIVPSDGAPPWAAEPAETDDGLPPPWESGPWGGADEMGRMAGAGGLRSAPRGTGAERGYAEPSAGDGPGGVTGRLPGGWQLGGRASWIVAGALTMVAVVVILVVTLGGGSPADPGCTAWQAAGRASYASVLADLNSRAPATALAAKLRVAIRQVNQAAAQARQASVQADLARLTSDMQTALADVARNPLPAQVRQAMRKDAAAAATACRS
jgi:hypothetical protein